MISTDYLKKTNWLRNQTNQMACTFSKLLTQIRWKREYLYYIWKVGGGGILRRLGAEIHNSLLILLILTVLYTC